MFAESNGINGSYLAGWTVCLRPGGPIECRPVVSATGDGFHAMRKAQRADTVFRITTSPGCQETDCAGLPGLGGSLHCIPVADATGMHCASPSGFIAAVRRYQIKARHSEFLRVVRIKCIGHQRQWHGLSAWPDARTLWCTVVGESSSFFCSGPSRRRGDHRR